MQSGTGVYYQALPAVGPDGQNVMKLIPVTKVHDHFFYTHGLPSRNFCPSPQRCTVPLSPNKIPTVHPTADGRFILRTPLEVNTVFNSVKNQHHGSVALLQSSADQVKAPLFTKKQGNVLTPIQPKNTAVIVNHGPQLQNTLKPEPQNGHFLLIPSNTTVNTLPASTLPSSTQNGICHPTSDCKLSKAPMARYLSPVNSPQLGQQELNSRELPQTLSCTAASHGKSLEESPWNNHGGNTPMKWVVEERAVGSTPYLRPLTTPSMSSNIVEMVRQRESLFLKQAAKQPVAFDNRKETVNPGNDDVLVMCNGKARTVAKQMSDATKVLVTNTQSSLNPRKSVEAPTTASGADTSNMNQKRDRQSRKDRKKHSDIIDLCGDDDEGSTCPSSGIMSISSDSVSEHDEDSNVIFVSYIPPKSTDTQTSKEVAKTTCCVKNTETIELDAERMETGSELNSACSAELDASKSVAVHTDISARKETEVLTEQLGVVPGEQHDATEKPFEETDAEQRHHHQSDSELRRTFGITSDLSVSLLRTDLSQVQEGQQQNKKKLINKRTLDGLRKLICTSSIETKIKHLIETRESTPKKTGKRKCLEKGDSNTFSLIDAHSSPLSQGLVECEHEIQNADQSTDGQVFQTSQGTQEEPTFTSGACKTSNISSDVLSFSSLSEPVESHTDKCQGDSSACCSELRKTPPRSLKGCGKMCTACPCGTKVGGVSASKQQAGKPQPKPDLCFSFTDVLNNLSGDVTTADGSVNSISSSSDSSSTSGLSKDGVTYSSQSHVNKDVQRTFSTPSVLMSQPEGQPEPAMTGTCSSSSSCTQDQTCMTSTTNNPVKTGIMETNKLDEVKVSDWTGYTIPSELYFGLLDPEEIKRQERIKRLKELLQEKEAALEKLRKSM